MYIINMIERNKVPKIITYDQLATILSTDPSVSVVDPQLNEGRKVIIMTNNTVLTQRALEVVVEIAATNDALTAGTKIYSVSRPDCIMPQYLKEVNYGLAASLEEEGGYIPVRMTLDDADKASIRQFVRQATGHKWHHSALPHRLARVGRAARALTAG